MLDRNAFLQFVAPHVAQTRGRVQSRIWSVDEKPLPVARTEATREHRPIRDARDLKFRAVKRTPHHWGTMFDQCFWKLDLRGIKTKGRYLFWNDRAEATAYQNGMPLFGFDPGHIYHPLPDRVNELIIESTCCRTGVWVGGQSQGVSMRGSRFDGAFLADRDDTAWALFHDIDVLLRLAEMLIKKGTEAKAPTSPHGYRKPFDDAPALAKLILQRLSDVADAYEAEGLEAAGKLSAAVIKELAGQGDPTVEVILTGHAHIDLVWLWPENVAQFKSIHSFANVISLMDRYPEYVFGYSQPASYDAIDHRAPKLMQEVGRRLKKGSFEHAGATYVESDTQLACGENLLRAFEVGQEDCRQRFGKESTVLWIPDVFGYSPCIPQLMAGFGVKYFYTTKLAWSNATEFPYNSFRWIGHDGTEVLTHITSAGGYNQTAAPNEVQAVAQYQRQAGIHDQALMPTGYGDGGGGTNDEMAERARRMADIAGLPRNRWGRIDQFFDRMAEARDRLPAWRGELYLEYHRGVHTTHCRLKEAFRGLERSLQTWEAAHAASGKGAIDRHHWKRLIFAQFHDYIPGSSIQRVYDEGIPELEGLARSGVEAAGDALGSRSGAECLFNPLPLPVTAKVGRRLVRLPAMEGIAADAAESVTGKVSVTDTTLRSDRVQVRFNSRGEITRMTVDGQRIETAEPLAQVWTFPDHPNAYDAWDIDRHTLSIGTHEKAKAKVTTQGDGKPIASISFSRKVAEHSTATVRFILEAGSPVLRTEIDLDWQDEQTLLKLVFPTKYQGMNARYGAPFGSVLRPAHPGPLTTEAKFEVPGSRWAAIADDTEEDGLMLVTEARYGFGCTQGKLHTSIVRSAKVMHTNIAADPDAPSPGPQPISDLGKQTARLAIGRYHAAAPRHEQPAALADTLFTPPVSYTGKAIASPLPRITGGDSLIPAWVKPLDDGGFLIRFHETLGRRGTATLEAVEGATLQLADMRGNATGKKAGQKLKLDFTPYALLTVRVSR